MDERYIALAIPFFFLLIGIEVAVTSRRGVRRYAFHDSIASLSCGIGQQLVNLGLATVTIAVYAFVHARWALFDVSPRSPAAWAAVLVLVDLCYYTTHRASHRVNALWAGHAVHHQSEEYNLTTALRQSWLEAPLSVPFYLPLAIVGFPPVMYVTALTVNTLYQFWIHTRAIDKLGPLEGFFNTPSSHRVHHGIDPEYIDKNYGGMFMLWDRLFGTYEPERREPVFGTVKPLASFDPLWANVAEWARLAEMARKTERLRDKLAVWLAPPEWRPVDLGGRVTVPEVDRARYRKYDVGASRALDVYVGVHFVVIAAATTALLWFHGTAPSAVVFAAAAWIVMTLVAWSGLVEARRWGLPLEIARLAASVGLASLVARASHAASTITALVGAAALASAAWAAHAATRPRSVRAAAEPIS
jgi:sterol desaturase/sphingolipid hydroxylase (fatty acid hydroxylase superfamily)